MEKEPMRKCDTCHTEYPALILYAGMCGICALEILNKTQHTRRTKFDNASGEYYRLEAIKWRKENGN